MKRLYALFPLVVAGFLAAASFWLAYVVQNERSPGLGNDRHDPDAIVEKFEVERFDAAGKLQSSLVASKLRHFPDNDLAEITQPHFTFNDPARKSTWISDQAIANNSMHTMLLIGNVRGQRAAVADQPAQTINTEELTVLSDDEIVRTDKPVTFRQGASRVDGVGAEWDNINGILTMRQARASLPPGSNP